MFLFVCLFFDEVYSLVNIETSFNVVTIGLLEDLFGNLMVNVLSTYHCQVIVR